MINDLRTLLCRCCGDGCDCGCIGDCLFPHPAPDCNGTGEQR